MCPNPVMVTSSALIPSLRDVQQDRVLGPVPALHMRQRLVDQIRNLTIPVHRTHIPAGCLQLAAQYLHILDRPQPSLLGCHLRIRQPSPGDQVRELRLRRRLRRFDISVQRPDQDVDRLVGCAQVHIPFRG